MDLEREIYGLSHDEILRIAQAVSIKTTQLPVVTDGAENVKIYIRGRDAPLWDCFAGAGANALGNGNVELEASLMARASSWFLGRRDRRAPIDIEKTLDSLHPKEWMSDPDYPYARIVTAMLLRKWQWREGFVPDHDFYTIPGTILKTKLIKEIYPRPKDMKVFLRLSGAEAIETVIKAWQASRPEREVYMTFYAGEGEGAFHGRTIGALTLNASKEAHRRDFPKFGPKGNPIWLPFPRPTKKIPDPDAYISAVEGAISRSGFQRQNIQGMFLELVLGEGGFYPAHPEFIYALEEWRKKYEFFLCTDGIQTDMCWAGTFLALEQYPGLEPEAHALGKALTAGIVPASAAILGSGFDYKEPGRDSCTFGGYQLGVAAAIETINWMRRVKMWEHTREFGQYMEERIREVFGRYPHLLDPETPFKGLGMMQGVRFASGPVWEFVSQRLLDKGVLAFSTGKSGLRFRPPQIMTKDQFGAVMAIAKEVMREADQKFG